MRLARAICDAGRLIVIEGLDGVGKTTLAHELASLLGARTETTPSEEVRAVRHVLDDAFRESATARVLFYAASVVALSDRVGPWLAAGDDVVVDRYWLSTCAYAAPSSAVALKGIEPLIRPADYTIYLEVREPRRSRRLRARGATASDLATLDPRVERAITTAYARGLRRRVAGTVVSIDTSELSAKEVAARAASVLGHAVACI